MCAKTKDILNREEKNWKLDLRFVIKIILIFSLITRILEPEYFVRFRSLEGKKCTQMVKQKESSGKF